MPSKSTIQRQSILSTIIIFAGFAVGAFNLLILQPKVLTSEQWGLTRVIAESAILLASFATLGTNTVVAKFLPFYRRYLPTGKNDLATITSLVLALGLGATMLFLKLFKEEIKAVFGRNNPLFTSYYLVLYSFVFFQGLFIFLEIFAWYSGKTFTANALKEFFFRLLTTVCLVLLGLGQINFGGFMYLFGFIYLPLVVVLAISIVRSGGIQFHWKFSSVTRRLRYKMLSLGGFVFLSTLSNIAFVVCDTLFLASLYSFSQAGVYAIAQYLSQVLEVPMRSMQTSSVPLIAEYWRARNKVGLQSIYQKSAITMLIAGIGLGGLIIINLPNLLQYWPSEYDKLALPVVILILARWVNLGTGLNAQIIQLSKFWKFDFFSTLLYSLVGIPLNFLLISKWGMMGAAVANLTSVFFYNALRFLFLWRKFDLQPFTWKTPLVLLGGIGMILIFYWLPRMENWVIDSVVRSGIFIALFAVLVIKLPLSAEYTQVWKTFRSKLTPSRHKADGLS